MGDCVCIAVKIWHYLDLFRNCNFHNENHGRSNVILSRAMCMFRSTLSSSGPDRYPAKPEGGFYLYNYLKFYEVKYCYMKSVDSQNWKNKHVLWNLSAEVKISSSHVKKCCVWTVKITKVNVFDSDVIGKWNKQMQKMPKNVISLEYELN